MAIKKTNYELMYIINPNLSKEDITKHINVINGYFDHITKTDIWGLRTFAYEIEKLKQGYYVVLEGNISSEGIGKLKHLFKIDKNYIRFMLINLDKEAKRDKIKLINKSATEDSEKKENKDAK